MRVARAVQAKLDEAKHRTELRKTKFQKERARVNSKVRRELTIAKSKIQQWKSSKDTEKLAHHANHAEQYALAAILDACDGIDVAEVAALEALDARLTADDAAKGNS
jgi:hypothetical protein